MKNCKDISTQRLSFQFFFQRHFESRCLKLASSLQLGIILIQSNLCTRRHHADAVGQRPQLGFQSTGLSEIFKSNWLGPTKEVLVATLHPCVKSAVPDTEMQASGSHAEPLAARWVRKREIKDSTPQADRLPAVMDEMVLQRQRLANQGVEGNPFRNP